MDIKHFMGIPEAAFRWGKGRSTIKQRLTPSPNKPSYAKYTAEKETYEQAGLIRVWKELGATNGTWYLSRAYMEEVYGPIKHDFE